MVKPICIDLFAGLGGWSEGFLAEGYQCWGFDIERHDYGTGGYPGDLVLQDVLTLHGSQFKDATVIVASPPCQKYSCMAMPWSRAKQIRQEYLSGVRSIAELNALFDACFRIQREANLAAGYICQRCGQYWRQARKSGLCWLGCSGLLIQRFIPLIVENVRGAQEWVGRSCWHFGSFHLWGDVPALMPVTAVALKQHYGRSPVDAMCADHIKRGGYWFSGYGGGFGWDHSQMRQHSSKSPARKAASAQIAKIPFALSNHVAKVFKNQEVFA